MAHLSTLLFALAVLAGAAAGAGLLLLWWYRRRTGFRPTLGRGGEVVASDTGAAPSVLLRDPALGLRGRPDYLLAEGVGGARRLVPLEVKPRRRSQRLYDSDAVQLGAYLIALRATYGHQAARSGYVRYAGATFRVDLTDVLERRVGHAVAAIRAGRRAAMVRRSHNSPARCRGCPMRQHCDEALA
jgi:CRISPR/Cas system-associated exonuclease Cas4 (RecB family)